MERLPSTPYARPSKRERLSYALEGGVTPRVVGDEGGDLARLPGGTTPPARKQSALANPGLDRGPFRPTDPNTPQGVRFGGE